MAGDVPHNPVVNPSIHYLGVEGATTLQDHAQCIAQNARIMAERSDEYGDQGAYNFQMCNSHGIRFEGRGWGRDSAANGIGDYNGVNYNIGSRAMCVLVGTDDVITDVCKAGIRAFANEAVNAHGMQWPLRGHSEFVATSCPGDHLRAVIAEVNASPSTSPPPSEEDDDMKPLYITKKSDAKVGIFASDGVWKRWVSPDEWAFVRYVNPGATTVALTDQWWDSIPTAKP